MSRNLPIFTVRLAASVNGGLARKVLMNSSVIAPNLGNRDGAFVAGMVINSLEGQSLGLYCEIIEFETRIGPGGFQYLLFSLICY